MIRQPRTPEEAAMLDPMGLMRFPPQRVGQGLFGASARHRLLAGARAGGSPPDPNTPTAKFMGNPALLVPPSDQASPMLQPPAIDQAPPPPQDWRKTVGADLLGQIPRTPNSDYSLPMQTVQPAPSMRAAMPSAPRPPRGMFGSASALPSKIGNAGPVDFSGGTNAAQPQKGGFDWAKALGVLADGLYGLNGQPPMFAQSLLRERQASADHNRQIAEIALRERLQNERPDYATVGNRRFSFNPATGESQTLYVAPSEAEDYATALGAVPGTPEFETLMSDYVLRHSGPTATANAMQEEDNRQTNRIGLEGVRQQNRIGMEGVRQGNRMSLRATPTYRDTHPRPSTGRGGGSGGGKGAPGGVREGQTATGPGGVKATFRSGQWMIQRGGQWVPIK